MNLLNWALQKISLQSNRMDVNIELRVKPATTLKKLRDLSEKEPYIKKDLQASLEKKHYPYWSLDSQD